MRRAPARLAPVVRAHPPPDGLLPPPVLAHLHESDRLWIESTSHRLWIGGRRHLHDAPPGRAVDMHGAGAAHLVRGVWVSLGVQRVAFRGQGAESRVEG